MKKLFQVVDRTTGKPLSKEYFNNKMKAKVVRDQFKNAKVIPGPDHHRHVEKS